MFAQTYSIDKTNQVKELRLFLCKPNAKRTKIRELYHSYGKQLTVNFGKINELSFSLPYKVDVNNKLIRNKAVDEIKEKYYVKAIYGELTEWFLINKISTQASEAEVMNVQCFSLGYQLWYRKIIEYDATAITLEEAVKDCVKGTGWKIGYINKGFDLDRRSFEVSSKRRLEHLYDIAETFEASLVFDTINKEVSFYKEDEVSKYKGFWLTLGQYINSLDNEIDADQIVTRLHIRGSDDLTINSVNPTGQSYLDDFSYLMFPFEQDVDGNVIRSSAFMSDELCKSLLSYNRFVDSRRSDFSKLLKQKKDKQELKTKEENIISELNLELQLILDEIQVAEQTDQHTSDLISIRNKKKSEIATVQKRIDFIDSDLTVIDKSIEKLKNDLRMDNFLDPDVLEELESNYIQEDEWSDDNKIDEYDLYESGIKRIKEINSPPINIKMGVVNFLSMLSEQHNWKKLNIGDIVRIKHEPLGIDVKTKVTQITYDIDNNSIDIQISNQKKVESEKDMFIKALYTIKKNDNDYRKNKPTWMRNAKNFNNRNDRIKETPTIPVLNEDTCIRHTENDDGSVNLTFTWDYPDHRKTNKNADNVDGFALHLYSSKYSEEYDFGSEISKETTVLLNINRRTHTFTGKPSNVYYTFGIRAYRSVDEDINEEGIIYSNVAKPMKDDFNPYRPSERVNFKGTIQGYTISNDGSPNSIPVRNENGTIIGNIDGDAGTVGGRSPDDFLLNSDYAVNPTVMECIAHRGHSGIAPENTVPSFQLAINNGFDSLECDVQISKDGHAVVIHDDTVNRTTNGTGTVSQMTLAQLRALDASYGMSFFSGTKIPTFDEYLSLAKGNSKFIYPEIKNYRSPSDIPIFVNKVKEHGLDNRCVMQSFRSTDLDTVRSLTSKITLGYLCITRDEFINKLNSAVKNKNAIMLARYQMILANTDLIEMARNKGIDVGVWTIDNSRDVQALKKVGIVRIIMNHLRRI